MNHIYSSFAKLWHQLHVRPRLAVSALIGAASFPLLSSAYQPTTRALMAWDVGASLYLVLAWMMIGSTSVEQMRWRARVQDDGAAVVLFLTVAAAVASLAAIVMELSGLKSLPPARQELHLLLVAVTFLSSWLLVHTSFALHYAHAYYVSEGKHTSPALEFLRQESPVYLDFLYFATVIGMTSQTADVVIASTRMRRIVMAQGLISFVFNTTLLALTINIAASLLG